MKGGQDVFEARRDGIDIENGERSHLRAREGGAKEERKDKGAKEGRLVSSPRRVGRVDVPDQP